MGRVRMAWQAWRLCIGGQWDIRLLTVYFEHLRHPIQGSHHTGTPTCTSGRKGIMALKRWMLLSSLSRWLFPHSQSYRGVDSHVHPKGCCPCPRPQLIGQRDHLSQVGPIKSLPWEFGVGAERVEERCYYIGENRTRDCGCTQRRLRRLWGQIPEYPYKIPAVS